MLQMTRTRPAARASATQISHGPTHCVFGGADKKTLIITARRALYRMTVPIRGI